MADIGIRECILFLVGLLGWQFVVILIYFWRGGRDD